jgi:sulfur carrier protein
MSTMIKVTHNDTTVEVSDGLNIWQFLEARGVKHPKWIVFELNGDIIHQDMWNETFIQDGDELESSYLSGGG